MEERVTDNRTAMVLAVTQLLRETEDALDAYHYAQEIADETGLTVNDVKHEIDRQSEEQEETP